MIHGLTHLYAAEAPVRYLHNATNIFTSPNSTQQGSSSKDHSRSDNEEISRILVCIYMIVHGFHLHATA
jgi:hypothetical protein